MGVAGKRKGDASGARRGDTYASVHVCVYVHLSGPVDARACVRREAVRVPAQAAVPGLYLPLELYPWHFAGCMASHVYMAHARSFCLGFWRNLKPMEPVEGPV